MWRIVAQMALVFVCVAFVFYAGVQFGRDQEAADKEEHYEMLEKITVQGNRRMNELETAVEAYRAATTQAQRHSADAFQTRQ